MPNQTLSLDLPGPLYSRLEAMARGANRTVEAEALDLLNAGVRQPIDIEAIEQSLSVLDDEALWRAARSRLAAEVAERSEELQFKAQREGLTEGEKQIQSDLVRQYERAMLVRAHAAALLKERGHDISSLLRS